MDQARPQHGFLQTLFAADTPGNRLFWNLLTATLVGLILLVLTVPAHLRYQQRVVDRRMIDLETSIATHARQTDLPPELVMAVVRCESGGNHLAHSGKRAKGLMQVTKDAEIDALRELKCDPGDLFDPEYNLLIGTTYLARLYRRFEGDLALVVAAYHMGQSRVAALRARHPGMDSMEMVQTVEGVGPQTRSYTRRVIALYTEAVNHRQ